MARVSKDNRRVESAVDLSRLHDDTIAETQLPDVLLVGREADLLEAVRRTQSNVSVPLELLRLQATRIGIPALVFEKVTLGRFRQNCIELTSKGAVSLRYTRTDQIYAYAIQHLNEIESHLDRQN